MNNKELLTYSIIGLVVGLGGFYLYEKLKVESAIKLISSKGVDEERMRKNLATSPHFKHFLLARAKAYRNDDKTFSVNHPEYEGSTYLTSNPSKKTK